MPIAGQFSICYTIIPMSVGTFNLVLITLGLGLLIWRGLIATRVGLDAHRRGFTPFESVGWALVAVLNADRYWWGARLDRLSSAEARDLLQIKAQEHRLQSVVNVRCPLCDHEINNALAVAANGELYVRRQATCPHCDFRLDACRHCEHFLPVTSGVSLFDRYGDFSQGRCAFYRATESVRTAYPHHARRLEAMGYETLPTPKLIVDSYIPLDECTAFSLKREYLHENGVPWINRQRIALIRLYKRNSRSR
jgi:hypothetical protein